MPACEILTKHLDEKSIKYLRIAHSKAYTSQELAAIMHVSGKELAKSVMVKDNDKLYMMILPASFKINFDLLKSAFENEDVRLASEKDFRNIFGECETGAMCPMGQMYDLPVYIAQSITDQEEIVFNAGTHTNAVRMQMKDYLNLVQPRILKISEPIWPSPKRELTSEEL